MELFPDLSDYLLNQVALGRRTELQKQLYSLSQKPQPPADFVTLVDLASYEAGLQAFVAEHIRVTLSEQVLHTPNWYLRASPAQRSELIQLEDATSAALKHYQSAPHAQVQSFEDYVRQRAREKINHLLGNPTVAVNPDSILIRSPRQTLTYTQLLRNGYDHSFNPINGSIATDATFSGPPGIDLSALTAQTVARSAHGTWLSDEYIARLRTTLLNANSTGYTYRRRASLLITQLQMKAAALRSRLKGDLSAAQLQWLTASIEQMHVSDSLTRQRYPIYPLQFRLDNAFIASDLPQLDVLLDFVTDDLHVPIDLNSVETVQGCYVLTRANVREPRHALLYTPQAPDGVEFRVFEHFADSLKREGMSDYYKDRCRLKANRTLAFFLIDIKKGGGSQPPVLPQAPFADLYTICFNRGIERKIRDVEETTTGRSDMLNTLIWDSIELIATVLTMPFPPASFAVGALLAFRDSARALMAFSEGDREAASGFILSSLLNSFGAAGDLQSGVKGFGEILRSITVNQGQNPSLVAAKQLQQLAPPTSELSPLTLHGEPFWAGKSNNSGHVALFRSSAQEPDKLIATGQFAQHDADKVLQPLRREISQPLLTNGLSPNPEYAVNISLKGRIPAASGHTKGVVRIDGKDYIELDGLTYQIQYEARMNYWNIIDPANPYAFFGKQPVRFNEQGQWQLLDRLNLRGGQPGRFHELVEEAAGSDTALANTSDYELPAMFQPYLFGVANPAGTSHLTEMDMGIGEVFAELFRSGRKTYGTLRQNLYRDAAAFFQNPRLAAKPELPILDQAASTETLLNSVFEKTNGLVISEAPTSVASKRLLIENMRLLAKAKVEILYVEHLLTDIHMPKLNKYRKLGIRARAGSSQLKFHLSQVNDGALNNQSTYDYYHVVKAAHQQGIEVRPFNSSVSYDFAQNPVPTAAGDDLAAQKMSTFFGSKVIDGDVAEKPARRWVALLDQRLATSHRGLPGIAELQGAISVRVKDIASDQPSRIARDLGSARSNMPRGDFRLEMANPYINEAAPATSKTEALDAALFNLLENPRQASSSVAPLSPHQYMGDQGFHWDDVVGWQRADAEGWSTVDQPTALQQSLADSRYELPLELRSTLHELEYFHLRGLNSEYRFSEPDLSRARDEFFNLRADLQRDARSILSETLSVRMTLPAIDPDAPLPAFLDSLYAHSSGVVIGEAHSCIASKKLIIDNLPHLAQSNVKTLYMEHLLTDLHQIDLDCFMETGQMSKRLLHDLRKLDRGHHTDPKGLYTFEQLIIHARKNAVEVRAIDCAASYFLKQMPTASTTTRQQMMNYFASRTLRKHQQVMGEHKWIALVGNTHANTFQGVPGLAELEQSIGVRVIDVRPGQAKPLAQDPGEQVTKTLNSQSAFLKNDFRLEMETLEAQPAAPSRNASLPTPTPGPLPPEVRVFSPGMFVIDDADPGRMAIVHRSRNNVVHRTPITRNWEGKLLVERESWSTVHQRPFDDLAALIEALKQMKLTHLR
ncbi:MAG: membrane-targeted effector domain-containing toxin [Pseudomonas sp.]